MADHRVGVLDPFFVALSLIGFAGLVWIALAPLLALWTRRAVLRTTLLTAGCVWSADLVAQALKLATAQPRPFERTPELEPLLEAAVGASFPSGHAATSFAGAVFLARLTGRGAPALLALAVLVSLSRIYVGVHYPLDVLAGALLGVALAAAFLLALGRLSPVVDPVERDVGRPPPL